jgi:hypothetical protein
MTDINIPDNITNPSIVAENDPEFIQTFNQFIRVARIQSVISLENFLNPIEEEEDLHEELTEEAILESVQQSMEEEEEEEEQIPTPYSNIPKKERIITLG